MKLVDGRTEIQDLDSFLNEIGQISEETESTIQLFDADYVAGEQHLRRAAELAGRAVDRGTTIAREPAVELLLYAAGRRQINRALEMGVSEGSMAVVGVVDGGDEAAGVVAVEELLGSTDPVEWGDRETLTTFFDIGDPEVGVVDGDIESIVLERVALLAVEQ
ncbi:KEOPS complex subunit Cgi121 [Halohasta litchfieldiae]|jgi:KEOPS complex subunit Cgi121|uniref:KEOPS complex subunit Cgi121 n=1 Tax=Halohasta litchfieldiae TaxID=1073996 RepID=A0A1H6R2G5_9EURY|nr:KEOPS complex subunit Cgi121 [Halohasta litchfieldiae]ATW88653.1 KEOPS complex subunit Cgi121 [Halohasta litchfieldiae]SEI47414.1 KEOPS complex subunit Cgi121 [Halohasta litchfieldiae]